MGLIDDIKVWAKGEKAPFTVGLMVTLIAANLYFWFMRMKGIEMVGFTSADFSKPWTAITYPWAFVMLAGFALVWFIFLMFWLVWIGMSVERDIGTVRMAIFWFVATVIGALSIWGGSQIAHSATGIFGPEIPVSALTVAWCTRNPTGVIRLYGILPITGRWLGWLTVGMLVFYFGERAPIVGGFAAIPLAIAYAYASDRIPRLAYGVERKIKINEKEATTRGQVRYDQTYFDEVKRRERERAEQERLKKLFGDGDGT